MLTGNPVRQNILRCPLSKEEAREKFGLKRDCRTVLVVGGSLGARTVNNCIIASLPKIAATEHVQFIWQSGKYYDATARQAMDEVKPGNVRQMAFVTNMDEAYRAADLVVSRAGASSISELQLLGKPSVLVPSPNVAEDHQKLIDTALSLVADETKLKSLGDNVAKMALRDSVTKIVNRVVEIVDKK